MNQTNDNKSDFTGTDTAQLHPQIKASLYLNNTAGNAGLNLQGRDTEAWTELVDSCIYPRIKFRERYMETPEAPYR
ncbi:hypothetical protein JXQ31_04045 [candidate division KSB1 bacterium]|nr:hypothetical protein [candidate division KSB1 bacterium]